ncbi:MAG: non-homologous end-joining DNA ligase [Bacillota bacterium]
MLPAKLFPMLATMSKPFDSPDFTYEIKWDGYRCLAFLDGETHLYSRNQKELSAIFPEFANLHQRVKSSGAILDGEIIALRDCKPNFLELQKRAQNRDIKRVKELMAKVPVVYIAFDLLFLNHQEICHQPLEERRRLLKANCSQTEDFLVADFIEKEGLAYFEAISKLGLEGVIAKKNGSPYLPGKRSKAWLKFKRRVMRNFVICGYTLHQTSRGELRSLTLGAYEGSTLKFCGMVGSGFTQDELAVIHNELRKIRIEKSPFPGLKEKPQHTVWVQPLVVCEVEYLELTDEGILRHPVFKRFRPDLQPLDCRFGG